MVMQFCVLLEQLQAWRALLQASAARLMGSALFWVITQRVMEIPYSRFGTIDRAQFRPIKICPKRRPETSVRNYHYSFCNDSEESISHKRHMLQIFCDFYEQKNI